MKSKRLLIAVAVILMLALVSCDFGGGGTNYRYTLPSWLHGTFAVDTATANYARAEAEVGQKYFVGIRGTSDTLYLIYKVKGTGPDSSSDKDGKASFDITATVRNDNTMEIELSAESATKPITVTIPEGSKYLYMGLVAVDGFPLSYLKLQETECFRVN